MHPEGNTVDSNAVLTIARFGGKTGNVSVDISVTGVTATPGSDYTNPGTVTVPFGPNQTIATVPLTIKFDTLLEGLETLTVSLTNAQGGASIDAANDELTLAIGDDDALINEVLNNVSSASSDETNREYIELIGTPGASLTGYYFVVFEGEEEENSGTGSGIADYVISLAGQSFGTNGLFVITPTAWDYQAFKHPNTNQLMTSTLDGVGGKLEDQSQTYALIRSSVAIVQGNDYDTVGAYESGAATAIGLGVGELDQLPGGAQIVDSVGIVEGGGGDRDRVATVPAPTQPGTPGVHVHQPEGVCGNAANSVASDGVSRRLGQTLPNSIGVWFNGDITNGAYPAAYANGTTCISVVAPGGAAITPGASNLLRTVAFSVSTVNVDEANGSVTLTVVRSDTADAISVNYQTFNGTAVAPQDYTSESGSIPFGIGDPSENIDIAIINDGQAEGFQTFSVTLSNATSPYLITTATVTVTIVDGDVLVRTFQNGDVNAYSSTTDAYLNSLQSGDPFGFTTTVVVDEELETGVGSDARPTQGLLRFDTLFGNAPSQVPAGAQIFSAFLTLNVTQPTSPDAQVRFFRMLQDWDEGSTTWQQPRGNLGTSILNGVTPDDVEATAEFDFKVTNPSSAGFIEIPVNVDTLQAWANGTLANFGWSIISDSPNDWIFSSRDAFNQTLKPKLTILYAAPGGQGTFRFSHSDYKVNENGSVDVKVRARGRLDRHGKPQLEHRSGHRNAGRHLRPVLRVPRFLRR